MGEGFYLVMVTAPSEEVARRIARAVVEEGLSACCNIVPGMRSVYMWKGKLCDEGEVLCLIKTRAALFDRLKERILELHPYEVPEIIAVNIEAGYKKYLEWIEEVTRGS